MSVFFNGRLLVAPTVESTVYDSGLASSSPARANNVIALIGTSDGGLPKTPMVFDSPVVAARVLRRGDLLRAANGAFAPSAETGSPARVAVVRIDNAVQSTLTLQDGASANVIALTSSDHGAHTNGIKVSIENGTVTGKRVTIQESEDYYSKDNLAKTPFTVSYTGVAATATVAVSATAVTIAAPTGTNTVLTLGDYQNVRELCDAINAVDGFSAIASMPTSPVQTALDGLTATSCKNTAVGIKADLQAIIDWINVYCAELVTAERSTGAITVPANVDGTYMTGGSNGAAPTNEDWQDAFDALQSIDVQWVVPLSSSDAIWYMADSHVHFMSGPGKSERRAFVGGDVVSGTLAAAISTARTAALSLNSDRTAMVFPSIVDADEDGNLVPTPAYFLAAKIGGGFAAMNIGNTMTNKAVTIRGLQPGLSNAYDVDELILGGITAVKQTRRGYVVAKAISTWLTNSNYNRVEFSTGAAVDYVARTARDALERFIGRKASPVSIHEAISTMDSVLRDLARPEPMGLGVIVGDEEHPAYRGITAEIQGDILRVWFECSPVIPINYVLIPIYAKAYSGSATAVINNG